MGGGECSPKENVLVLAQTIAVLSGLLNPFSPFPVVLLTLSRGFSTHTMRALRQQNVTPCGRECLKGGWKRTDGQEWRGDLSDHLSSTC